MEEGVVRKAEREEEDDALLFPDLDPLDDKDFVIIIGRIAEALSQQTERQDAKALRDALDLLDVNWALLSPAAIDRLIAAARAVLARSVDKVVPRTSPIFTAAALAVIPATRARVIARDKLGLDRRLTELDQRTGQALLRQQGLFIRDEYGRRSDAAASRVRAIVNAAVDRGLSQDEITALLVEDVTLAQLGRAKAYWEVLGTAFANRARTTTQLTAYEEAGVETYRFVAVLDHRTTDICRYLNGKIFRVSNALARLRKAEELEDADAIRDELPWVHTRVVDGRKGVYFERRGTSRRVAYVDDRGEFTDALSDEQLEAAGVCVPPLHVHCRSTIIREG